MRRGWSVLPHKYTPEPSWSYLGNINKFKKKTQYLDTLSVGYFVFGYLSLYIFSLNLKSFNWTMHISMHISKCTFLRATIRRSNILKTKLCELSLKPPCLINYCDTRWVERHEAIIMFKNDILPIIGTLKVIMSYNYDDGFMAPSFHKRVCDYDFLITLVAINQMSDIIYYMSIY